MGEVMEEEDRISLLPDELLSHILTYLDSLVAVQTCVLSKRWVNLWTTLPCLNFRITAPSFIVDKYAFNPMFVTNFLNCRNQDYVLKTIKVHRIGCKDISAMCLDYAVSHNVEHLRLHHGDFSDAHCLNSASIKTLHLSNCMDFHSIEDWVLPSLTSLYLWNVWVGDHISGFQNLKELTLSGCFQCSSYFDEVLTINCPNLESLSLGPDYSYRDMVVHTPNLSYLEFRSDHVPHFCAGVPHFSAGDGFPCIKEVDIDIEINDGGRDFLIDSDVDSDQSGGDLLVDSDVDSDQSGGDLLVDSDVDSDHSGGDSDHSDVDSDVDTDVDSDDSDVDSDHSDVDSDQSGQSGGDLSSAISNFISMLDTVRETPVLKLSSATIQFLQSVPDFSEYRPSPLCNLKFLYLQGLDEIPSRSTEYVIKYLLSNSPRAEILEGHLGRNQKFVRIDHWITDL